MDERRSSLEVRAKTIGAPWQRILIAVVVFALSVSLVHPLLAQGGPVDAGPGLGDPYFPNQGNSGFDVTHYDLDLQVDPKRHVIRGAANITLTPTVDLRSFTLDLAGFDVSSVDVDGASAQFERVERKLRVLPARPLTAGNRANVRVIYAGKPQTSDRTGWLWYEGGGALVSTQTNGASTLFPCNDHPSDKATFSFALTVPRGMVGVANGLLNGQSSTDAHLSRFEWNEPAPFPTYAAVVAVGRYRLEQGSSRDGLPIISAFPKVGGKKIKNKDRRKAAKKDLQSLKKKFQGQGDIVSVLDDYFGPYPYSSIGAIVPPIDNLEPIEAASRPTYPGVSKVLKDKDFEQLVAHEIAHQWFGNAVALRSWRDIWLNEGFSTYGELLWIAAKRNVPVGALFARKSSVFGYYPEMQQPAGDPGAENLLSVTVYNRGALTLEALRRTVGDETFFRILRTYVDEYRGGNATTEDFIALAESISGQELSALFQRWLYEPGLPELPPE